MFNRRTSPLTRFLDRYALIPLLFIVSLFRKKRKFPAQLKRICFVKTAAVGDMVLLSAVIKKFMDKYPDSYVLIVCSSSNLDLGFTMTGVETLSIDYKKPLTLLKICTLKRFDTVIDFGAWARYDVLISMLISSSYRTGFNTDNQYRHYCYDSSTYHNPDIHELANYFGLVQPFLGHTYDIPHHDTAAAKAYKNTVCLHMFCGGSRSECRMWDFDKWRELIEALKERGLKVAVTGSDKETEYLKSFDAQIIADKNFQELGMIFSGCYAVISINCGISHFAAACGAYVVEIMGATDPERWGALGRNVEHIVPFGLKNRLNLGFENTADKNPNKTVTVQRVLTALDKKSVSRNV